MSSFTVFVTHMKISFTPAAMMERRLHLWKSSTDLFEVSLTKCEQEGRCVDEGDIYHKILHTDRRFCCHPVNDEL